MAVLIGAVVGGSVAVLLLSWLLEWAIFKRVMGVPETAITLSVIFAAFVAAGIYGFVNADGGAWSAYPGGFVYLIGGCIVLPLRLRAYRRRVDRLDQQSALEQTFE